MARGLPLIGLCYVLYTCVSLALGPDSRPWNRVPAFLDGEAWFAMTWGAGLVSLATLLQIVEALRASRAPGSAWGLFWSLSLYTLSMLTLCDDQLRSPCLLQYTLVALSDVVMRFAFIASAWQAHRRDALEGRD